MIWALDDQGKRVNAREISYEYGTHTNLITPCCKSVAIYVSASRSGRRSYFRHSDCNVCEYAENNEYSYGLHWDIVDLLEEMTSNEAKWGEFLKKNTNINWLIKRKMRTIIKFQREVVLSSSYETKRTDVQINDFAIEIQCSSILPFEIYKRESIYKKNHLNTYWIIGILSNKMPSTEIHFPFQANHIIQRKFRSSIKKNKKWLVKIKKDEYIIDGINLDKWQMTLLNSKRVFAIYYQGQLYPRFKIIQLYTHVPKQYFDGALRKKSVLILIKE